MLSFKLLGKDLISYGMMGALSRSVNLLLLPILTRQFSPEEYGTIDVVATLSSLLAISMSLSLESAVARQWFDSVKKGEQKQLVSSIMSFILFFGTLLFSIIYYQADWIADWILGNPLFGTYIVLGTLSALLTGLSGIPQIVLRMERKIVHYNALLIVQSIFYVVIALLLIFQFETGLQGVFVANVLASALAFGLGLLLVSRHLGFDLSLSCLISGLRYSLPMFPAVAVTWVNKQADRIILLALLGISAVGIFGVAAKIALIIGLMVSVFQQAWTPLAIAQINDVSGRNAFYRQALNYYIGAMSAIALVFSAFSKELLALLAPPEYQSAYVVIPWLSGALILHGSGNITNIGMLISKRTSGNSIAAVIGSGTNITIGLLLIPRIGLWGAAIGSFVAGLIFTGLLCYFSMRITDIRFDFSKLLGILFCYVMTCIAVIATYEWVNNPIQSLIVRIFLLVSAIWVITSLSLNASTLRTIRSAIYLKCSRC